MSLREGLPEVDAKAMYLGLLKRTLTRYELEDYSTLEPIGLRELGRRARVAKRINSVLAPTGLALGRVARQSSREREYGLDWPVNAETMIGLHRLDQLHDAMNSIRQDGVTGDLLEAGVWRGGAAIFMAAFLRVHGEQRKLWLADSFEGLPAPDPRYPSDVGDEHFRYSYLSVSDAEVIKNFRKYGLMSDNVALVKGFFADTLPNLEIDGIALLRLDGDMYSSTIQVLDSLYDKVSSGGFVIVDDYALQGARGAVHDFLDKRQLAPVMHDIDGSSVYWRVP